MFSHPQESRASSHVTVTWEDRRRNSHCPLPTFLFFCPPACMAEHDVLVSGISVALVSWGQLSQPCPLPASCQPQPTRWRGGVRNRETLTLCKRCSATAKPRVCYRHGFRHKSKMRHHPSGKKLGDCDENELHPSQNQYKPLPGQIPPRENNY